MTVTCWHRDCDDELSEYNDDVLPGFIRSFECLGCGELWILDTTDGTWDIN